MRELESRRFSVFATRNCKSETGRIADILLMRKSDAIDPERSVRAAQNTSALPPKSDVNLFCYREGVVDFDAEVANSAFDLGMPQQELYGSQVAGSAIDQGCLGPAKGMRPEQVRVQSDVSDPVR